MGQALAAEIGVAGVRMGVDMDHAERPLGAERPQDRVGDDVVAADRERRDAALVEVADHRLDPAQRVGDVDRVDRHVADIRAGAERIRRDMRAVIDEPHQRGGLAHLARPEAGAGPVGGGAVERDADERDVDLARRLGRLEIGQPHEGRDAGEARHHHAGQGLVGLDAPRAVGGILRSGHEIVRAPAISPQSRQSVHGGEDALDPLQPPVDLLAGDGERRREAQDGAVGVLRQDALGGERIAEGARGDHVRIDLDAGPQAASAHVGDDVAAHRPEAVDEIGAELGRALDEALLLDDVQRLEPDPRRERVAAEGRAVRAGIEDPHELRASPRRRRPGRRRRRGPCRG